MVIIIIIVVVVVIVVIIIIIFINIHSGVDFYFGWFWTRLVNNTACVHILSLIYCA